MAMTGNMCVTDFFNAEYQQYAIYDSYRSIASYVDGLKPSARKVIHTVYKNNITKQIKVAQLGAKVAEETHYLHGEVSMFGVLTNMGKSYTGTNNVPLIKGHGNFGCRFLNDASASRYIHVTKSDVFDKIFMKEDYELLPEQMFEGDQIEPRHYMPVVPVLLLNGSEGIGSGFAQKILPRNAADVKSYIMAKMSGGTLPTLNPYYTKFRGSIVPDPTNPSRYFICGTCSILNTSTVEITELPPSYELPEYLSVLDKLVDDKIIKSYVDKSDSDEFRFVVKMAREDLEKHTEATLLKLLKLSDAYSENYTCLDEYNGIREFKNVYEIIDAFIDIRLQYYEKRKSKLLENLHHKFLVLANRGKFIKHVLDGNIQINKKTKSEIDSQITSHNLMQVDGSFDYLLKMPLYSLTQEKITDILSDINNVRNIIGELQSKMPADLYLEDLANLKL